MAHAPMGHGPLAARLKCVNGRVPDILMGTLSKGWRSLLAGTCLIFVGCASQAMRPHLAAGPQPIAVVAPGMPSTPVLYDANPLNFVPLVNMIYPEVTQARLGDQLQSHPPPLSKICFEALINSFAARGLAAVPANAEHPTSLGVPQLLSEKQVAAIEGNGTLVDWIIQRYGFSVASDGDLQVTMQASFSVTDGAGHEVYFRRIHYRPPLLGANPGDLTLEVLPTLPTWRDAAELKSRPDEANEALATVCKEMVSVVAAELT